MNQKKAKALRRAAKQLAARFPIHNCRATYQDIVRQVVTDVEVVDENIAKRGLRALGRLFGVKTQPKTKKVEKVVHETRQTVLASGWRFIQQRLKGAVRRGEARIVKNRAVSADFHKHHLVGVRGV